jgi:hypothetical protein
MVQSDASFCGQCGFNLRAAMGAIGANAAPEMPPDSVADESELPPVPDLVPPEPLVPPAPLPEPLSLGQDLPQPNSPARLEPPTIAQSVPVVAEPRTQLQQQSAKLLHVQTNSMIELPQNVPVIHLGKPNDRIPPDIDVSGFPHSEIVSRIHADIRVEGDAFYIEDIGSSNGTYINNAPLPKGNRHRLRAGDRIALGKGDKVSFLFILT